MSEKYKSLTTKKIGQRMRLCRKQSGLSQAETCTLLNISQSSLSRIESGSLRPTDEQIDLFLNRLKIEPDYFLTDENFSMKIVGAAGAGFPTDRLPEDLGTISDIMPTGKSALVVKVEGYSMEPTINNGDYAVVDTAQKDPLFLRNKIICARVEGEEHVIKRLIFEMGTYYLKSDNPHFPLISVGLETQIEGLVTNIIRKIK
ncbi:LexA family protein [Anaerobiospirillum thomasii]|uniref:LexA repressor n=1 Tax=Anaerobiospirillum thomasii TaxID=179995 RepID=A0A2X0V8H6_9GAMM|nr:S24 family peptidase [Anaerobiospirillum thomasii]SPT70073.1 LexA repressor [Anaerobiospirillum thomasii]